MDNKICARCLIEKPLSEFKRWPSRIASYCNPCLPLAKKDSYNKNIESQTSATLIRRYGITLEQQKSEFEKQDRRCAICNSDEPNRWQTDHDHSTKAFRGILCIHCNRLLGAAKDNVEILEKAIVYLKTRRML